MSRHDVTRVYLDRLAYTPHMIEQAKHLCSSALMDSTDRLLANLGLSDVEIEQLRAAPQTAARPRSPRS